MRIGKYGLWMLVVLFCLSLSGCDFQIMQAIQHSNEAVAPEAQKVNIIFWDENAGSDRTRYYRVLIHRFEEENPDIHVEYVGLPKKAARLKINTAITTNELPDVCGVQSAWIAEFCAKGVLMDLDTFFSTWNGQDELLPATIQANRALAPDGGLYQLPNTMGLEILWYRPDWLEAAGISPPETWDAFFAAVESLTDKGNGRYGFTLRGGDGASIQLLRMMFAYSGYTDFFTPDGHCRINDPKHVEFLKRYLGLYQKYTPTSDIANGYQEMVAVFDTGQAAILQHNIGSYGSHRRFLQPDQYAPLMLPRAQNGFIMQEANNVDGYGIFKTTQHAEAAWRFVSFLCSAESQSFWNKSIGQIPTNQLSLSESWVDELPHMRLAREELTSPQLRFYEPPMYLPEYRSTLDSGDAGIQQVMMGKKSVEKFLDEWAHAFEKAKKKYDAALQNKQNR
jgi:multiple sugar transport system substrate-binding protein